MVPATQLAEHLNLRKYSILSNDSSPSRKTRKVIYIVCHSRVLQRSSAKNEDTITFRLETSQGLREESYDDSSGVAEEESCFFWWVRHAQREMRTYIIGERTLHDAP